jgi:hypothetical protein
MDPLKKYLEAYQGIIEVTADVPPRPRTGSMLFMAYCATIATVCGFKGPEWLYLLLTAIFIIVYIDVRSGFTKRPRDRPD